MSDLELRVENLNVGFGRRTVLRDISFTVHSGEFICLLGQNAAGKPRSSKPSQTSLLLPDA